MRNLIISCALVATGFAACKKDPGPAPRVTGEPTTRSEDAAPAATADGASTTRAAPADGASTTQAAPADAASEPAPADAAQAGTGPSGDASALDAAVRPARGPLEESARGLVTTWLAAQNQGDFEAYAALYAARFTGIKRAGDRERKFGHEGWLADRKRMFKAAMQVKAEDVAVAVSARSVVVTFVQTWASGSFQDKGPKLLVLVPEREGLRIAREEMLRSEIADPENQAKPLAPEDFMFALELPEGSGVVLPDEPASDWASGEPQLVKRSGPTTVRRAVDTGKLPADLKDWIGKKVTVAGFDGKTCQGAIERLELLARYQPHFGQVQYWDNTFGDAKRRFTDAEVARDAWDSGTMDVRLVGRVPGCSGAMARDASRPWPPFYAQARVGPELERAALAEFRRLSGWKAIADSAKDYPEVRAQEWDTFDGAPSVRQWASADGARSFVQVTVSAGTGCGQFGASFGALFELKKARAGAEEPTLVLLSDPEGGPTEEVQAVIDLDGDGDVELLLEHGLIQRAGATWSETQDVAAPDYDCPC